LLLSAVRAETSIDRGERRAGRKYQTRRAPDAQQQRRRSTELRSKRGNVMLTAE